MYKLSRRQLNISAGAGLLLAPFVAMLGSGSTNAATTKQVKRLLLFCTMGTKPDLWTPKTSGESITSFSAMTAPLSAVKDNIVLVEGLPTQNPANNHGAPDGLTGLGNGYYTNASGVQQKLVSVDQYIADKLAKGGVNRPIGSLVFGAETTANGGKHMFFKNGNMMDTIASPSSAFNTVFGTVASSGGTGGGTTAMPDAVANRRKKILELVKGEIQTVQGRLGASDKAKLDQHLDSINALENKIAQTQSGGSSSNSNAAAACKGLTKPTDSTSKSPIANDLLLMDIMVNALACDITRVASIQLGSDQMLTVDTPSVQGEQHNEFLHAGSPNFTKLIAFETWMAQQFANLVTQLKMKPDPDGGSGTLLDSTLVVWARDMGDAVDHNMKSMRFILASGTNGYLKTAAGGRYINASSQSSNRHERVLLNLCEAMGITDYSGFGDPMLSGKSPLPGIAAT